MIDRRIIDASMGPEIFGTGSESGLTMSPISSVRPMHVPIHYSTHGGTRTASWNVFVPRIHHTLDKCLVHFSMQCVQTDN